MRRAFFFTVLTLFVLAGPSMTSKAGEAVEANDSVHGDPSHHVALFLGAKVSDGEAAFSVGVDYEYELTELLGIGAIVEYSAGHEPAWLFAGALTLHATEALSFTLAPGVEIEDGEESFLLRLGASYEFELAERWTIGPDLNVDIVDGEAALVVGIGIGRKF